VSIKSLETKALLMAGKGGWSEFFLKEIAENCYRAAIRWDKPLRSVCNRVLNMVQLRVQNSLYKRILRAEIP
jgi:hypothetical protein